MLLLLITKTQESRSRDITRLMIATDKLLDRYIFIKSFENHSDFVGNVVRVVRSLVAITRSRTEIRWSFRPKAKPSVPRDRDWTIHLFVNDGDAMANQ